LVSAPGTLFGPQFSPDGQRIRFSIGDPAQNATSLWEVRSDGADLHALLPGWNNPPTECCGKWTANGRYYVFQVSQSSPTDITNLWAQAEPTSTSQHHPIKPIQLTAGPFSFGRAWPDPENSQKILALGVQPAGEVVKYDPRSQQFAPVLSGISATDLDFSQDGQWVTYRRCSGCHSVAQPLGW
jgi:Tol biopolymer transport system component